MAEITRDTHDDDKNYHKVVLQKGQPLLDAEGNEAQDNLSTHRVESLWKMMQSHRATQDGASGDIVMPNTHVEDEGLAPYASGTANIFLQAGAVFVEGYRLVFSADVNLGAQANITFEATASAETFGIVYADVFFTETTSSDDADIATAQLGETSRREKLDITFRHSESGTSFNDAWTSITALTPAAGDRIWKGNVARIFICRYHRANATSAINNSDLVDFRQSAGQELSAKMKAAQLYTFRPVTIFGDGNFGTPTASNPPPSGTDPMLAWRATSGRLIIGALDDDELAAPGVAAYRSGIVVVMPTIGSDSIRSYYSNLAQDVRAKLGSGDADGTRVLADWTNDGIVIADGQALGYLPVNTGSTEENNFLITKNGRNNASALQVEFADHAVAPTTISSLAGLDAAELIIQELVVADINVFERNMPNAFIIVQRIGADLLWANGQVTRGRQDGMPVITEIGHQPEPYDVVVAQQAPSNIAGRDAVERAIEFTRSSVVAGELGTSTDRRIMIRKGTYTFTRLAHQIGAASEFSTTNEDFDVNNFGIELIGDGPTVCQVETEAIVSSDQTIFGNVNIRANKIVLEGLTFEQSPGGFSATLLPRYTLYLEADEIVIRNCHFNGGVYCKAGRITIEKCAFIPLQNTDAHRIQGAAGNPYVAQHLRLENRVSVPTNGFAQRWEVTKSTFIIDNDEGTHASIVIAGSTSDFQCNVDECVFKYANTPATDQPSIHIDTNSGHVDINRCRFKLAQGVGTEGADTNNTAAPFDGDFTGSPATFAGGTSNTTNLTARAYISCVGERSRSSSTRIRNCRFEMDNVGLADASSRFIMWGACVFYTDFNTAGATAVVANVVFENNILDMELNGARWDGTQNNPVTWGFYMAPSTPDGAAITNLVIENINVRENTFQLGGQTLTQAWRAFRNEVIDGWPAGGTGYLTDPSCLVGVVLKNLDAGVAAASGRHAVGVEIYRNRFLQGHPGGGSAPGTGALAFTDADLDYYWSYLGVFDSGYPQASNNGTIDTDLDADYRVTAGDDIFLHLRLIGNYVWNQYMDGSDGGGTSAGGSTLEEQDANAFFIARCMGALVQDNLYAGGGSSASPNFFTYETDTRNGHYRGNYVVAGTSAICKISGTIADEIFFANNATRALANTSGALLPINTFNLSDNFDITT